MSRSGCRRWEPRSLVPVVTDLVLGECTKPPISIDSFIPLFWCLPNGKTRFRLPIGDEGAHDGLHATTSA